MREAWKLVTLVSVVKILFYTKRKTELYVFFATEKCELFTRANILHLQQQTEKVRNNMTDIQGVSFFSY